MHRVLKNIRDIRIEKEFSQEEIAKTIGVSQSAYARFESGATRLDYNVMEKVALALQVTLYYVIHYHQPDKLAQEPFNRSELEILKQKVVLLESTIEDKRRIIDLLIKHYQSY